MSKSSEDQKKRVFSPKIVVELLTPKSSEDQKKKHNRLHQKLNSFCPRNQVRTKKKVQRSFSDQMQTINKLLGGGCSQIIGRIYIPHFSEFWHLCTWQYCVVRIRTLAGGHPKLLRVCLMYTNFYKKLRSNKILGWGWLFLSFHEFSASLVLNFIGEKRSTNLFSLRLKVVLFVIIMQIKIAVRQTNNGKLEKAEKTLADYKLTCNRSGVLEDLFWNPCFGLEGQVLCLEASSPRKLPCSRLEYCTVFWIVKIL